MNLAALELQKAVFAALAGNGNLTAALGGAKLYDLTPAHVAFPYVAFGPTTMHDWSTDTEGGSEHFFTLTVWSARKGRREVLALMGLAGATLHDAALELPGHALVNLRHDGSDIRFDEDLSAHLGLMRFRAVVEPV